MINYVLINIKKKEEFEKQYQLPYGCGNSSIYKNPKEAVKLLNNMSKYEKNNYAVEKWDNGEYMDTIVRGEWLE